MSKKATEFQRKAMSWMYRGKEIFKPLNTGWIDENVACVREWVANIFFYRKGDTTIMVDAGYNYDRLAEKMGWLGIDPKSIHHILITHQDTDHVGAVEADSPGLFRNAKLYIGEIENRYLTGEVRRKVIYHLYKLPQVTINNEKVLLHDGQVLDIDGIRIECFLVPGHTWGHMVYLIDDKYLFTGDTLWFGADGGYIVYPLIKESEKMDYKDLEDGYAGITQAFPPPEYVTVVVHGKMKPADKDYGMNLFKQGVAHIMIATSVIEVGVDVPNASIMVIESAERFGLSQLHQLRGRVGRGGEQSYCILMSGDKLSSDSRKRLAAMVRTTDGFELAEMDLQLRGPGDLSGTLQSGLAFDLKIASLGKDGQILTLARDAAERVLADDPELAKPQNKLLCELAAKYVSKKETDFSMIS